MESCPPAPAPAPPAPTAPPALPRDAVEVIGRLGPAAVVLTYPRVATTPLSADH
jgi:hypothetical protein